MLYNYHIFLGKRSAIIKNKKDMHKLKLFFSWQSDTKDNHEKIVRALQNACDDIRADGDYDNQHGTGLALL